MSAPARLRLHPGTDIVPASEMSAELRERIGCRETDFAVTVRHGRSTTTLVDGDGASLLRLFEAPRSVPEAILAFSLARGLDPATTLRQAVGVLEQLTRDGVLIAPDEQTWLGSTEAEGDPASLSPGAVVAGARCLRLVRELADSDVWLVRRSSGEHAALKRLRAGNPSPHALVQREAEILERLGGEGAPRLLDRGEIAGGPFLLLSWCEGVRSTEAADELHRGQLCAYIARAYADLHSRSVLHGDIHPGNILVGREGEITLLDFGCGAIVGRHDNQPIPRVGVPFYFDPEHARSLLAGETPSPVTAAAEQYSIAALLYHLMTGGFVTGTTLERQRALERIAYGSPPSFSEQGCEPWPELEAILRLALASDPADRFPSTRELADELQRVAGEATTTGKPTGERRATFARSHLRHVAESELAAVDPDAERFTDPLPAPTASVTYGAAGIALALYRIACLRTDGETLALADLWWRRAAALTAGDPAAFRAEGTSLVPETVGETSPFHTESGVWAVGALIAGARGRPMLEKAAFERFVESSGEPRHLDLAFGFAGTLSACALLAESTPDDEHRRVLAPLARTASERLEASIASEPAIAESAIDHPGIAHGWGGLLFALLRWAQVTGEPPSERVARRLEELGGLATPVGRGYELPWILRSGSRGSMSGWCNGSAGHVLLWCQASATYGDDRHLDLAERFGWHVWEAGEPAGSLCCGRVGRAYALLSLYRATGDRAWLDRATTLAERCAAEPQFEEGRETSLFRGPLALATLAADLEQPELSAFPLLEAQG